MDAEILAPREHSVEIAGRVFTLREMPARDMERYFKTIKEVSSDDFSAKGDVTDEMVRRTRNAREFLKWICPGMDDEFIEREITPSMVVRIVQIQNRLNGIDDFLKKIAVRMTRAKKAKPGKDQKKKTKRSGTAA